MPVTKWNGRKLAAKARAAQMIGIDQTMARCVIMAKTLVRIKTATLQGSLRFEPARPSAGGVRGRWGSFDVNYALWQEIGTSKMSAKPYLRPAGDFEYGLLGVRIRRAFAGMAAV